MTAKQRGLPSHHLVINLVAEKLELGGRIAAILAGAAWAVVTMLVVPVILFEDRGVFASVRRSAELARKRWGEGATGYGSIGIALAIVMIPFVLAGAGLTFVDPVLGVAAMVTVFVGLMFVASTLGGVFNAALYRYAVAGEASGPFSAPQLQGTFVTKEERQQPARRALRIVGFLFLAVFLLSKVLPASGPVAGRLSRRPSFDPPSGLGGSAVGISRPPVEQKPFGTT